jgi:hypothetical protein
MQEALSQTAVLLRRHPILWLPQFCAALLVLVVNRLYNLAAGAIWHLLWHPSSTHTSDTLFDLMTVPEVPAKGVLMTRAALQTPLLLLSNFLEITLYTIAFALVIIFVQRFMQGLPADPRSAFSSAKQKSRDIVYVALITVGLFILKLLLVVPIMSWITAQPGLSKMPIWYFEALDWVTNTALLLAVIYFVVPTTLNMARSEEPFPPSSQTVRSARFFAVAIAIFWILLQYGWQRVDHAMFLSYDNHRVLWLWVLQFTPTLTTVVALTFISAAFAVLATNEAHGSLSLEKDS